jgi:hypothetical protein
MNLWSMSTFLSNLRGLFHTYGGEFNKGCLLLPIDGYIMSPYQRSFILFRSMNKYFSDTKETLIYKFTVTN